MTSTPTIPVEGGKPLSGVVVVDITHVLAGPFATMLLGDLGATVLKIEKPDRGDTTRATPPLVDGFSTYYGAVNRNKRSVCIDITKPDGQSLVRRLAERADIFVQSLRPGVLSRYGLSFEELRRCNKGLIYCSISGFGSHGTYSQRPAFDGIVQALAGVMSLTGQRDGPPLRSGLSIGDLGAGLFAIVGVLAALRDRDQTGFGQEVEVGMFDVLFNLLAYYVPATEVTGVPPVRASEQHPTVVPMGTYETADGHGALAAFNQKFWQNLCRALEREEWINRDEYASPTARSSHRDQLNTQIQSILRSKTTDEWDATFLAADVPFAPVQSVADLLDHPLVAERELLTSVVLGNAGKSSNRSAVRVPIGAIRYSRCDQGVTRQPPALGEDTKDVLLGMLGLSDTDLARLAESGVIGGSRHPMLDDTECR